MLAPTGRENDVESWFLLVCLLETVPVLKAQHIAHTYEVIKSKEEKLPKLEANF